MIKLSRNNQIIFYIIILIFVTLFFFYFFRQASVTEGDFLEVEVGGNQPIAPINKVNTKIDINLFTSEKFRNLRSEVAPIQSFQTGKRNPFEPY